MKRKRDSVAARAKKIVYENYPLPEDKQARVDRLKRNLDAGVEESVVAKAEGVTVRRLREIVGGR